MKADRRRTPEKPVLYAIYYKGLCQVARKHGYALAIHGSMRRDFDLVAIPWKEECSSHIKLLRALAERIGWKVFKNIKDFTPSSRNHGRMAYVIPTGNDGYIDLSIMPVNKQ